MRVHLTKFAAVAGIVVTGLATRFPGVEALDAAEIRERFAFERRPIASVAVDGFRTRRPVQPALEKIATWISGVGAGLALTDVDRNGRSDDVCLSDPRTDTITVSPASGTGNRYAPFILEPGALGHDRATTAPMGCLPGDFNEDGRTDLLTYYWGRTPVIFFRSDEGASPSARSYNAVELVGGQRGEARQRWYTDTIASADVDGDGHLDLIVGNYFPDGARLLDRKARSDPAMAMNDSMSRAYNGGVNRIYRWTGRESGGGPGVPPAAPFAEEQRVFSRDAARAWTLAIGAQDFNGDLLPELYFANDFGPDRMFVNRSTPGRIRLEEVRGENGFRTPKSKVLGKDSFKGMGIDFADMNGDGRTDMFVSNISTQFGLMESNYAWINTGEAIGRGHAPFRDESDRLGMARTGWGWDVKFGDFDNDSVPELVQATGFAKGDKNLWPQIAELAMSNDTLLKHIGAWPRHSEGWDLAGQQHDVFFTRTRDGRWTDLAAAAGIADRGVTRGVATADVDADGRLDFALARQWEPSYLYRNRASRHGGSLSLRLLLPAGPGGSTRAAPGTAGERMTGSPAVGARATVRLPDGRRLTAQVDGGNGHASARSVELHFGLGELPPGTSLPVRVDWRDRAGRVRHTDLTLTPGRWSARLAGGAS
ncbi:CRTAC1 family protein [Actinomadura sp. 3N407]|uniref:CRTAC1 family protein n=1 Tax=Actinomadura sp. 3N407 TaxID=3457423 RepID=UPI003FCC5EE3